MWVAALDHSVCKEYLCIFEHRYRYGPTLSRVISEIFDHGVSGQEYIAPELYLLLMMSLFTFYVVYFPLSFSAVYIIIFLPVVPFTYIIYT